MSGEATLMASPVAVCSVPNAAQAFSGNRIAPRVRNENGRYDQAARCEVRVSAADGAFFLRRGALRRGPRGYFLGPPEISAAVAFVLGGETAISGGECAPEASSGLDAAGVTGDR